MAASAIALTVISLTQAISIARAIALKSGQRIDADQEFIGQGLGNIAASFFSGFPTSASVNRSGPNFESGARTPLAAVFAALLLAIIVLAFAPLAAYLPLAAMAGSLFLVAWALIDFHRIRAALRTSRGSVAVIVATFLATLLLPIEFAVLTGVFVSLLLYLYRTSRPTMRSLVPDARHPSRKFAQVEGELKECPQAKILRIEGSIYFGAVNHVETHFETLREVAAGAEASAGDGEEHQLRGHGRRGGAGDRGAQAARERRRALLLLAAPAGGEHAAPWRLYPRHRRGQHLPQQRPGDRGGVRATRSIDLRTLHRADLSRMQDAAAAGGAFAGRLGRAANRIPRSFSRAAALRPASTRSVARGRS